MDMYTGGKKNIQDKGRVDAVQKHPMNYSEHLVSKQDLKHLYITVDVS